MGTEIEKKVICRIMGCPRGECIQIEQRYLLVTSNWEVRIRRKSGKKATFTVKSGRGLVRGEWERTIPCWIYCLIAPLLPWKINKKRYFSGPWEIDIYPQLAGLAIAEVELSSVKEHVPPVPDWLLALADITEKDEWKNKRLAVSGFPHRKDIDRIKFRS